MDVKQALETRKSVRAFLGKPVDQSILEKILLMAGQAPSGVNTQPWQVVVLTGKQKRALTNKLETAFKAGIKGKLEYSYYPDSWVEPYRSRRKECGTKMYAALGIERGDRQHKRDQWAANYRAFEAPVVVFFFMDRGMQQGSFLDYGMFLQSLMLAAVEEGLATCPQASLAEYPDIVRQHLGVGHEKMLLAGMSIGYEDGTAAVNNYRTSRLGLEEFVTFFGPS